MAKSFRQKAGTLMVLGLLAGSLVQPLQIHGAQTDFSAPVTDCFGGWLAESPDTLRYTLPQSEDYIREAAGQNEKQEIDLDSSLPFDDILAESSALTNTMVPVSQPNELPYRAVVKLRLEFAPAAHPSQKAAAQATGYVIGKNTILTCAHSVYDHQAGLEWARKVEIFTTTGQSFSSQDEAISVTISKAYANEGAASQDLAVVTLESPIGQHTGMLKPSSQIQPQASLKMAGFSQQDLTDTGTGPLYESAGTVLELNGALVTSNVYGQKGQSGAPLLNAGNEAVGVFGYGLLKPGVGLQYTGGVRFDNAKLEWIARNSDLETPIYRLYNPNSSEHFYTASYTEMSVLEKAGWKSEGLAWYGAPPQEMASLPVLRLYNPNAGDHHYTTDENEYAILAAKGWIQEGEAWLMPQNSSTPESSLEIPAARMIYRLYNPNAQSGAHHFTTSLVERNRLIELGWKDEGQAFARL